MRYDVREKGSFTLQHVQNESVALHKEDWSCLVALSLLSSDKALLFTHLFHIAIQSRLILLDTNAQSLVEDRKRTCSTTFNARFAIAFRSIGLQVKGRKQKFSKWQKRLIFVTCFLSTYIAAVSHKDILT